KQPSMIKAFNEGKVPLIKTHCMCITTKQVRWKNAGVIEVGNGKYRYLTERECFRLMGFEDSDFDKIIGIPSTQLYALSGNSIVVDVLEAIFKELLKGWSIEKTM